MEKLGYVKLYRLLMDEGVFDDADLWRLYCWCLLKASHQERDYVMNKQINHLEPGQFIFGRHVAAEQLNEKESNVRNWMQKLKELGMIEIEAKNKYSIVTVTDWYLQSDESKKNNKGTANGQHKATDNNVKNVKNNKSAESIDLADEFARMTGGNNNDQG